MDNTPPTLYCENHPQTETTLRCNRCEKPICTKCAVLTPTGYRCKECVKAQQKTFDTAQWIDYPLAFIVAGVLAYLGSLFIPRWFLLAIFGSPIAGTVIAEAVRLVVRRRRSKKLFLLMALGMIVGCLPNLFYTLQFVGVGLQSNLVVGFSNYLPLLSYGIYVFLATSTAYYRLAGISLRA
jgi:hypothetical protein